MLLKHALRWPFAVHDLASIADSLQTKATGAQRVRRTTSQAAESRLAYFRDHPLRGLGSFPFKPVVVALTSLTRERASQASLLKDGACLAYAYLAASAKHAKHPDTARTLVDPSGRKYHPVRTQGSRVSSAIHSDAYMIYHIDGCLTAGARSETCDQSHDHHAHMAGEKTR